MTWRALALSLATAAAGAAGTLAVGRVAGMNTSELAHLGLLLLPAVGVTAVSALAARRLLARASFGQRLTAIALTASLVSLANLAVLAALMFVSGHDAALMAILLLYSVGAGAGAAIVLGRSSAAAVDRLARTADELAAGNLDARVGRLGAGPELEALAETIDTMAERLKASIELERAAETTRRDLITAVSHDLRTPLSGVRAIAEAIEDGVVEDLPTLRRYASEMRRQIEILAGLVDDLFELSQLDAETIAGESERARLADVVGSAVKSCRPQADEKGLRLEERLDGAGEAACSTRLTRVLHSLLQNAIRHTPADGTVRVEARQLEDGLEVAVADTGEGIPPEALERVFEPLWRGDAARATPGSGLGLALAKRIVEALGGGIRVESTLARGTRFAVLLPEVR